MWNSGIVRHREEVSNENRERLFRICAVNELLVTNVWCHYKEIHDYTWVCPDTQLRHIID